ncbi:MAG TPA: POTRA domain-containing protein [Candidatus Sulfotelmatobacter sp.]|nr:POTRA domain-containing protein [Candidatus Sulfotelmatobacter sp.]
MKFRLLLLAFFALADFFGAAQAAFVVRRYVVDGGGFFSQAQIDAALVADTGTNVDPARLQEAVARLQLLYFQNDYDNVRVSLAGPEIRNGLVHLTASERNYSDTNAAAVTENLFAEPVPVFTNTPAKLLVQLTVRGYQMEGNSILPPADFGVLSNYTGTNITMPEIREGLGKIQLRYRELGFPTISVTLPQQKLTNGIVRVNVVEGRIADIKISGNKHFSDVDIRRALPDVTTNILLNTKWLQPELDQANQNRDRQVYPVVSPGFDPGTTALELRVKDRTPLHGHMEVNDKSSPGTPLLRVDTTLQYDNLWQLEHQIGADYNFSPQAYKPSGNGTEFYDLPLVTSYSAFYRIPLGSATGEREELEKQPATFGYDEVNHKFNMPPPTGHPDLTIYASRSASATPVRYGPLSIIFTNPLANISSQFGQQNFTYDNNIGAKFTLPVRQFDGVNSAFSLGLDFKTYDAPTFSTNLTYFSLYGKDSLGNVFLITNKTISLPSNSRDQLAYIPLSFGWSAARPDDWGGFAFGYSQSVFLAGLASARTNFQVAAGAPRAGGSYTTINAGLAREQKLPRGWSALLNLNGQWASAPLIANEQFALGGTGGVRGYQQGEIYGDDGWRALFDLRAPAFTVGNFPSGSGEIPAELRCSWFMDYGQAFLIDRPTAADLAYSQWGTGLGFFLTCGDHFDARFTLAWALLGTQDTRAGTAQAYFSVGAQF